MEGFEQEKTPIESPINKIEKAIEHCFSDREYDVEAVKKALEGEEGKDLVDSIEENDEVETVGYHNDGWKKGHVEFKVTKEDGTTSSHKIHWETEK